MSGKTIQPIESRIEQKQAELEARTAAHLRDLAETHARLAREQAALEALKYEVSMLTRQADSVGLTDMGFAKPLPRPHGGRRTRSKHPFPRAVGNVRQWAAEAGVPWSTVKTWFTEGDTLAPIPRFWQVVLERTYGIPASAWRGGVRD